MPGLHCEEFVGCIRPTNGKFHTAAAGAAAGTMATLPAMFGEQY